jgi:hypothetical protein
MESYTDEIIIGPIHQWFIEYTDTERHIWIQTQQAMYRLIKPNERYLKIYETAQNKSTFCAKIISVLDEDPTTTLKQMSEKIKNFTLEDFKRYSEFIVCQLETLGDDSYQMTKFYSEMRNIAVNSISDDLEEDETSPFASGTSSVWDEILSKNSSSRSVKEKKKKSSIPSVKKNRKEDMDIIKEKFVYPIEESECIKESDVNMESPLNEDGEMMRTMTNFSIFDNKLNLHYLYRFEYNKPFFAFGDVSVSSEESDEEDEEGNVENAKIVKNVKFEIVDWKFDYDQDPVRIMIRTNDNPTDGRCWYILQNASEAYDPLFEEVETAALFCSLSIPVILSDPITMAASDVFHEV